MRKPSLINIVLYATALTFILAWLPLVRCVLDGESYLWGQSMFGVGFSGAGLGGDLWYLALKAAIGIAIVWLGTREKPGNLFMGFAVGWAGLLFSSALYESLTTTRDIRFHGDSLGIDISVKWLAPAAYALLLGLVLVWVATRRRAAPPSSSGRAHRPAMLVALAVLLPIQFVLLRLGEPHGLTDQIGVILTILQWTLLPWALWRWVPERVSG